MPPPWPETGSHLFGCEPSRVMLQKAREWLYREEAQVVLVGSIAEDLPFVDGSFQRVVCKGAIDHFMNPQKAVAEMCRVACPKGRVVLSVANFESLSCHLGRWVDRFHRKITGGGLFPGPTSGKSPRIIPINSTMPPLWRWPSGTCRGSRFGASPSCGDSRAGPTS